MTVVAVEIPSPSLTVADLLTAVARGERSPLDELVRRFGSFIHAAALRQTGDAMTADDVTQAVFLVLREKAHRIKPPALAAWLHQTTRYAAANANRAAKRRRHHERAAAKPEAVMPSETPEPNPLLPLLDEAIATLREADRRLIVARYLLGQDVPAVAADLGVSTKALQKRLDRAIERLRHALGAAHFRTKPPNVKWRVEPILPAAVVGVLLAAAPSSSSAVVTLAAPSAGAAALAKSAASALAWANVKAVLTAVAATLVVGGVAGVAVTVALPDRTPPVRPPAAVAAVTPAAAPAPPPVAGDTSWTASVGGASFELVGMAEHPSAGKPWYAPNGLPLLGRPFDEAGVGMGRGNADTVIREFAVRTDPDRVQRSFDDKHPNAATARLNWQRTSGSVGTELRTPFVGEDYDKSGVLSLVMRGRAGVPMSATIDVAAGPWVPRLIARPGDADQLIVAQNDVRRAMLTQPFEDDGEAAIGYWWAEFYSNPDRRFVAIDTDGVMHFPDQQGWAFRPRIEHVAEPVLDTRLPAMKVDRVPFGDFLDRVRDVSGLVINVDWDGLREKMGVTEETLVTTDVNRQPLWYWLPMAFQDVRGDKGSEPTFTVKDGVITIVPNDYLKPQPIWYRVPGVSLERLARFEVQTRAFDQWVTFENLNPALGQPSELKIRTSDTVPPQTTPATRPDGGAVVKLPDGSDVRILALGDVATNECWRPDGTPIEPPFGYRHRAMTSATTHPNRRRVWLMTTVRRPDGRFDDGRGVVTTTFVPKLGEPASGVQSWVTRNEAGVRFQIYEMNLPAEIQTLDWRTTVASGRPWTTSIERGPIGWDEKIVGRLKIGDAGEAVMWSPTSDTPHASGWRWPAAVRVWTPPTLGRDYEVRTDFVLTNGDGPDSTMIGVADKDGFRQSGSGSPLNDIQRITLKVTHYDQTAAFRNVELRPNK